MKQPGRGVIHSQSCAGGAGGVERDRDVTGMETEQRTHTTYADKTKRTRSTGHPREQPRLGLHPEMRCGKCLRGIAAKWYPPLRPLGMAARAGLI